jgi:RimJ/RimL family protein N-acetyltransferase
MELTFRAAQAGDVDVYYRWVNDPLVRANSFNQAPIPYEDHVKWFHARVASPTSFLYLFFNAEQQPVGQVRIDHGVETIIDVSVDENFRGRGYSSSMLSLACTDYLTKRPADTVFSYIKKTNGASYRIFLKCGFAETGSAQEEYHHLYLTDKNRFKPFYSFEKNGLSYEIKLLNNLDPEETGCYFDLFCKCFGQRPHLDQAWFDWFYNKNPYGLCNNYALVDREKNSYAGVYGLAKYRLVDGKQEYLCGVGVNGMIDNDYRNQGLYTDLMRTIINHKDENEMAVSYPHGLNRGSVLGHLKAGWELLKKPEFYKTTDLNSAKPEDHVREIRFFSGLQGFADLDAGYASYFEKTAEWLDWRFFSRPHKTYDALAYFNAKGSVQGYAILGYYMGSLSRCQLLDYRANDPRVLRALISGAKHTAAKRQCAELDLWLDDQSKELGLFKENGFHKTGEFYELMVFSKMGYTFNKGIKTVLADLDAV